MIRWSGLAHSLDVDTLRKYGYPHSHERPVFTTAAICHMRVLPRFLDILDFLLFLGPLISLRFRVTRFSWFSDFRYCLILIISDFSGFPVSWMSCFSKFSDVLDVLIFLVFRVP